MTSSIYADRAAVFEYFASHSGAGVKLSTAVVLGGGIVRHNYVAVHSAPPVVVKEIIQRFPHVSLHEEHGLLIQTGPSN